MTPITNSEQEQQNNIENTNVLDIWWSMNPSGSDYSFFSIVNNSHCRTDYFLVDIKLMPFTTNPKYHTIGILEQSPHLFRQ